jgi:hypothetical protein
VIVTVTAGFIQDSGGWRDEKGRQLYQRRSRPDSLACGFSEGQAMSGEAQVVGTGTDAFAWDATANPLPAVVDVAIIGGGIVGC